MGIVRRLANEPAQAIVVSGNPVVDDAVRALRHGVIDFFVKPVELEQVQPAVQRAVHRLAAQRSERVNRSAPLGDEFLVTLGLPRQSMELLERAAGSPASRRS